MDAPAPVDLPAPPGGPALPAEGRRRVVIEGLSPAVDGGRFPVKRIVGDELVVEADVFADGHDEIVARLLHRPPGATAWESVPMVSLGNDRWRATVVLPALGRHAYSIEGWTDRFLTWRHDLGRRVEAGQDVRLQLLIGAELLRAAAARVRPGGSAARVDVLSLEGAASELERGGAAGQPTATVVSRAAAAALAEPLLGAYLRHPDRRWATRLEPPLEVVVDPPLARFGSWYELFPRSASPDPDRPGTLRDVAALVPRLARLGFDVLYLPPIHPIGLTHRKGRDGAERAGPSDPGSPWAIGSAEGGHTEIDPALGTFDDFAALVAAARRHRMEIALDLAFQASPDHPEVGAHPAWFRQRPDGSVQYAENPPKRYEDIYPFDFESDDWAGLWAGLEEATETWIERGVRIFRVDNPHTKPFGFWAWLIEAVKARHPEVIFLAEAFTRPKVMYRLAKLGFSQSYTYFTWRTGKAELEAYFEELTRPPVSDFFRPNLWPNTPDILHEVLQSGGRPAFALRAVLAATLGAAWGVYGPPFELLEATPRDPGSEEYLHAEKYEVRHRDLDRPGSLGPLLGDLNRIRRSQPALQRDDGLRFRRVGNDALIAYTKQAPGASPILCVVNLDPHRTQAGLVELPLEELGLPADGPYEVRDLLDGAVYGWQGRGNHVVLDPAVRPAHVLALGDTPAPAPSRTRTRRGRP